MPGNEWQLSASLYQLSFYLDSQGTHLSWDFAVRGSQIAWMCSWRRARSQLSGLPLQPASIFSRGNSVLALMRAKKKRKKRSLQQSGGIIMGATSPAVAGSYSPRCGATADRMELNPVWALGVKAVTMGIFYGGLRRHTTPACPRRKRPAWHQLPKECESCENWEGSAEHPV